MDEGDGFAGNDAPHLESCLMVFRNSTISANLRHERSDRLRLSKDKELEFPGFVVNAELLVHDASGSLRAGG